MRRTAADMDDTPVRRDHPVTEPQPAARPTRPEHRATGASLIAVICIGVTFVGIMVLHAVRSDVDPLHDVMSHYANGSRGPVMSVVFYAFGAVGHRPRHPACARRSSGGRSPGRSPC